MAQKEVAVETSDLKIDATFKNLSEFKDNDIEWVVTPEQMLTILEGSGYFIDDKDNLIKDSKTKEPVLAEDGLPINVKRDKRFALIGGSHHFVRNVTNYAQYLINNNLIKIEKEHP